MVYTGVYYHKSTPQHFMEIAGPAPTPPTLTVTNASPTLSWKVGQRLDALVIALTGQGKVSLRIGGAVLEAQSSLVTSIGQRLHLEVIRSDNQVVLRIISPPPSSNSLTTALRETLPHQQPLQTIFSRFTEILSSSSGLSSTASVLLKELIEQLPTHQSISRADVLKKALMDSGLFLEHRLSTGAKPASLTGDLKANLLRLVAELGQGHDDAAHALTHHAEAGLARIQLNQLSSLANTETAVSSWTGELPVRHDNDVDVFQFHIEREGKNSPDPEQQGWCTWLSFNIKTLGPMHVKLTMSSNSLSAVLWAEMNSTVDLVNQNLTLLHQSLSAIGLQINDVQCLQGSPPRPATSRLPKGILDITA